jgi:hypothetical protein
MIYAFCLLLLVLSLVISIPALRRLLQMRRINRRAASANGYVDNVSSSLGWLWTSDFGSVTRPLIKYDSPQGKEMAIEVAASSMFTFRRYEPGMRIEVIYDSASPWEAYARPEWTANLRDFWIGLGSLVLSIALYILGRLLGL